MFTIYSYPISIASLLSFFWKRFSKMVKNVHIELVEEYYTKLVSNKIGMHFIPPRGT